MQTIRVIAGEGHWPYRDETGRTESGRYYGRDEAGDPRAETVTLTPDVERALRRGALVRAPEPVEPETTAEEPVVEPAPAPAPTPEP